MIIKMERVLAMIDYSVEGELPVYRQRDSGITLTTFESISSQLQDQGSISDEFYKNYNADFGLTGKQLSDIKAYAQWLQDKLLPGLLYTWWVDAKNYLDLSRPWFARVLPFPLNYFVPGRRRKAAQSYLMSKYGVSEDEEPQLENLILKHSQECLNLLAERLEKKEFFFGRSPTSMDALVFAYLAPLLKVPFPNPILQNHLKNCNNLVSFVDRILRRYFPSTTSSHEEKPEKPTLKTATNTIDEFPNKYRNQFLAGLVAIAAMVGYAITTGLVQVDISNELEIEEVEDEEEEDFQSFYEQQENGHNN